MTRSIRTFTLAAAAGLLTLALTTASASAQFRPGGRIPNTVGLQSSRNLYRASVNPNYYIAPGLTLNQYAYNIRVLGRAYSYVPPYALGYNPYPVAVNYGPTYLPYMPYTSAYVPGAYNPYAYGYLSTLPNPYLP